MSEGGSKYAPVPGQIPGTEVILSGVKLNLAPINVNQARALRETLKQFAAAPPDDASAQMDLGIPLIFASAVRNHPDITEEDIRNLVDIGNFGAAMQAAARASGYVEGEGKAVTTSTGTASSPTSSPQPDGPGSTAASS